MKDVHHCELLWVHVSRIHKRQGEEKTYISSEISLLTQNLLVDSYILFQSVNEFLVGKLVDAHAIHPVMSSARSDTGRLSLLTVAHDVRLEPLFHDSIFCVSIEVASLDARSPFEEGASFRILWGRRQLSAPPGILGLDVSADCTALI